jgi:hypothetical protein
VDSEHSAILQCLAGSLPQDVRRLVLTASGGPIRQKPPELLENETPADALRHPTWDMGAKVSIDSATLANKALEVIEAHFLFGIDYANIEAVVHPQSIIHSMVEMVDGSVLAQMGFPTMELPVLYALSYPERLPYACRRFDPVADFTPIALIGITPQMLCHHPKHKFRDVPDFIKYCKANPGKISFASSSVGSIQHIAGEAFKLAAGVDMLHVPFKGTGEAMSALLSGDVDTTFSSTGSALPQVRAGKLTLLAVCSPKRLPAFPDVPAVNETLKGYEISTWYGLAGPGKLPKEIVDRLNAAVREIVNQPDIAKRLQDLDAEVSSGTPEQFATFWKNENEKYKALIARAKIEA